MRCIIAFQPGEDKPTFVWCPVDRRIDYETVKSEDFVKVEIARNATVSDNPFHPEAAQISGESLLLWRFEQIF